MNVRFLILHASLVVFVLGSVVALPGSQSDSNPKTVDLGDVNKIALKMPLLEYPRGARAAKVYGIVKVRIWIDKKGDVVRTKAISGHRLLRSTSIRGAQQSKFPPNLGSCDSCRYVTGILTYTFVNPNPSPN